MNLAYIAKFRISDILLPSSLLSPWAVLGRMIYISVPQFL